MTPREAGLIISKSPSRGNIIIRITLTQPTYKRIPIEFNVTKKLIGVDSQRIQKQGRPIVPRSAGMCRRSAHAKSFHRRRIVNYKFVRKQKKVRKLKVLLLVFDTYE